MSARKPSSRPSQALIFAEQRIAELEAENARLKARAEEAERERESLRARLAEREAEKDGAYRERNALVAALSKLFPAWLERHPHEDTEWEDDWRWIVFISLPTGQVSWHIHDSELSSFRHLWARREGSWDGHTTEEKYRRLAALEGGEEES